MFVLILNHARYPTNPRLIPRARAQASHGNITVLSLLKTVSHRNGPYGQIPTKKEPVRTLGFTSRLPCHIINNNYWLQINEEDCMWTLHVSHFNMGYSCNSNNFSVVSSRWWLAVESGHYYRVNIQKINVNTQNGWFISQRMTSW